MEADISMVAAQLARAVELTMDPSISQEQRHEAFNACEVFKEKSPLCVQCGLYLAQRPDYSYYVRHFGLQLMEHSIKYKWYTMSQEEKIFIKEKAMALLEQGMDSLLVERLHMRDALSRVVVEMVKREWPQQWGSLLQELSQLSLKGTVQTELVLLILLRLVEDVVILQTLESGQRRKDLQQALTISMADLFSFFLGLIDKHFTEYNSLRLAGGSSVHESTNHARVVQVVLLTLCAFVEWVHMNHIAANDGKLLQILCMLLGNEDFQDGAAECLLHILSRKGKAEERKPLLLLFRMDAMNCIFQAANNCVSNNYQLLKKLTRVLVGLGTQLTTLWTKETKERPTCFQIYLEAIVSFAKHPSLTLVYYANSVLNSFMKHEFISKDEIFLLYLPKWVQVTGPKIIKIIYPTSKGNVTQDTTEYYAVLDYDSEEEFSGFFHRYRVELLDAFKLATTVVPSEMYDYVSGWLQVKLRGEAVMPTPPSDLSATSPLYLEWDALTLALDSVLSKIVAVKEQLNINSGLSLIDMCLMMEPADPVVLSAILSCISALFVFLSIAPPHLTEVYLARVLDKIFSTLVFSLPGETKTQRSRGVKNLRRHAASLMVKISQKYPRLLLPVFSKIHSTVRDLQAKPDTLSTLEATTLQEALLLISNHICDYEKQTNFVAEVVGPVREPWLALTSTAFSSVENLMKYVGLDSPPREPSIDDISGQNRSQIQWCLDVISGVVKRCSWPSDLEQASKGGFLVNITSVAAPVHRNPAAPHILPLLPGLLALAHSLNALATPHALNLVSQGYKGAYNMVDVERQNLMGAAGAVGGNSGGGNDDSGTVVGSSSASTTTPIRRMQQFISTTHETLYHALAMTFMSLGHDAYSVPNLAPSLIASVFSNLESVPDYRLRHIVRVFLKLFVSCCPPSSYDSVLLPVMAHFTPHVYNRLCVGWQHLTEMRENGTLDDENTDTQEVLEDILNRTLTKEYLDVVKLCLYGGGSGVTCGGTSDSMEEESDTAPAKPPSHSDTLSELGAKIITCETTCTYIILLLLKGLSWNDSLVSLKCTHLVGSPVVYLSSQGRIGPELAGHVITSVLYGLQMHGQHESNLGSLLLLGTLLYSILRPLTHNILKVMEQIPNVNMADLQKLDDKMLKEVQKGVKVDKAKKEMFKKVTHPLIGCNVSQLFKKKASIRDLPRLEVVKPKQPCGLPPSPNNLLNQLFNS